MTEYKNYRIPESIDEILLIHSEALKYSDVDWVERYGRMPQMMYSDSNRNIIISIGITFEDFNSIDSEEKKLEIYNNRLKYLLDNYSNVSK
jgi:hypothetical protein